MNDQDEQVIEIEEWETVWSSCLRHKVIKQDLRINDAHAVTNSRAVDLGKKANQNKLEEFDTIRILLKLRGGNKKKQRKKRK